MPMLFCINLLQDRTQEEIIKFLEESFSEDFPADDANCDNGGDEGGTSSSGELEPKRKVKTGKVDFIVLLLS